VTFQEARQKAFNEGAKALLEGRDADLQTSDDLATRDILGALGHIRDNYPDTEDRRGKLMVVAAVEGLSQDSLVESIPE
jgi:hypothetical protein